MRHPPLPHRTPDDPLCALCICLSGMPLRTDFSEFSKKWPHGLYEIGHLAEGAAPPHSIVCTCYREATYGNYGTHYQAARRREIGMDTRNEMCRANTEERTTGYAN